MLRSGADTVDSYLAELPEDRRAAIAAVRNVILENLPDGYEETMNWGMISYEVPLSTCPDTYNGQPLMYAALASQKNHMAVYLTGIYMDEDARKKFEAAYEASGKKLNAGKSCVRFRKLEDVPLPVIGESIAAFEVGDFVRRVQAIHAGKKRK